VKAIDRVSSIKSKSKDSGKSNSPKNRWVPMSERVLSPQPVTQYNHITGEVRMESEKADVVKKNYVVSKSKVAVVVSEKSTVVNERVVKFIEKSTVVKEMDVTSKVDESNKAVVVAPVIEKVPVATETDKETEPIVVADVKAPVVAAVKSVVEKGNPKVTSKVSNESVKASVIKESVKVPVVKKNVKASSVVIDKPSSVVTDKVDVVVKKSVKASSVVEDKPSSVVADKVDVVVNKSVKASSVVIDKPSSVVVDKVDVLMDKVDVVADKASDALKNKPTGKGKKPVVGKDKDKPKNITPDVVKETFKPYPKQKVISSEISVLRLSKQEENPEFKAKKDVSDSELETDVVDYSFDEADRKRKKLKIKAGLKRKRSGLDSSDSLKINTKSIKRLISKLEKKVKKQESDEDSVPKKSKKKLTKKVEKEVSDEESLPKKGNKKLTKKVKKEESDEESIPKKGDKIKVTPSKIHDMLGVPFGGYSLFDLDEREADHEFVRKWAGQFYPLELKKVRVNDIARKLIAAQEIDFLFKVNFLDGKLPGGTNHYFGPLTFLILLYLDSTKFDKFSVVRTRPAIRNWSSYLMEQRQELELKDHVVGLLDLHDDWNEAEVQESKGFIGFSETFEKESKMMEMGIMLVMMMMMMMRMGMIDGGNVNIDANDCDGNGNEEDVNEGDKDPNGSNPSFGLSKISLEDFGNDSGPTEKDKVVEGNPTEQGTIVEGNEAEECEIMSTPENFTQWLEKMWI
nr:hypothetical protein [Tanacetum cinerariifolium]